MRWLVLLHGCICCAFVHACKTFRWRCGFPFLFIVIYTQVCVCVCVSFDFNSPWQLPLQIHSLWSVAFSPVGHVIKVFFCFFWGKNSFILTPSRISNKLYSWGEFSIHIWEKSQFHVVQKNHRAHITTISIPDNDCSVHPFFFPSSLMRTNKQEISF